MLTINDLKPGTVCKYGSTIYEILEARHSHIGRGGSLVETKIRNLKTGAIIQRSFKQADAFEGVELEKVPVKFLYQHRGVYWFSKIENPKERFSLGKNLLDDNTKRFLRPNLEGTALVVENELLAVKIPVKVDLKIIDAPPGIRGDTAQGGSKIAKLETGAEISVPLFINPGDIIRINTESGEYVERVTKAK